MGTDGRRQNNIGAIRLGLALLVVVSHVPELIDGDRGRELLTLIFGTLSFGELAVQGFFLVSGWLVTQSWMNTGGGGPYYVRRILRIYPAFIVAYLASLAIGWLCSPGAPLTGLEWSVAVLRGVLLLPPQDLPGAFGDAAVPALNGSLGTIAYEFRCYLLVGACAALGLLSRRRLFLALALSVLVLGRLTPEIDVPVGVEALFGTPQRMLHLASPFLMGAAFYLYRDKLAWSARGSAVAGVALFGLMFTPLSWIAVATVGAYCLFALAFGLNSQSLRRINVETDVSYGVYLYSWPLTNALIYLEPGMSPWLLAAVVALLAIGAGWLSWRLVEKPALALKSRIDAAPATALA